jgi:hypothetical protein
MREAAVALFAHLQLVWGAFFVANQAPRFPERNNQEPIKNGGRRRILEL